MASGSSVGYAKPRLMRAEDATRQANKFCQKDAMEMNLGLLVEEVNREIQDASEKGKRSIRFRLPEFIVGGSLYEISVMRPLLVSYLIENGGYEAEFVGDNAFYLTWGSLTSSIKRKKYEENNNNIVELTKIKTTTTSSPKTTTPTTKKQKTTNIKKKGKNILLT